MKASFRFINLLMALALAIGAVVTAAPPQPVQAASTSLVISQFQVAGGTAADEFIEIHNVSAHISHLKLPANNIFEPEGRVRK